MDGGFANADGNVSIFSTVILRLSMVLARQKNPTATPLLDRCSQAFTYNDTVAKIAAAVPLRQYKTVCAHDNNLAVWFRAGSSGMLPELPPELPAAYRAPC